MAMSETYRDKDHVVVNVYGAENVENVEAAITDAKREEGVETDSDALAVVCGAFIGNW